MKPTYRLLSVLITGLPLVWVALAWDELPDRIPLHFNNDRQPDQFGNREQWLGVLLRTLFLLSIIRVVILKTVGSPQNMQPAQRRTLDLLTAGFAAGTLLLLTLQGLRQAPIYTDWLPVLFFLSGCAFIYFAVPPVLPTRIKDSATPNVPLAKRLATVQHMYKLSRLVVFRVNLIAVILMAFASHSDRWSIGILANALAYLFLLILTTVVNRNSA